MIQKPSVQVELDGLIYSQEQMRNMLKAGIEAQAIIEKLDRPALAFIAGTLQAWITHDEARCKKEGMTVTDAKHIMSPPTWPSHGQLKAWVKVLREAAGVK